MKNIRTLSAAVALLAASGAAMAADVYSAGSSKDPLNLSSVPVSWTGFYLGGNLGYGWDSASDGINAVKAEGETLGGISNRMAPAGWFAGVQAGVNWQIMPSVLGGAEIDVQIANLSDDSAAVVLEGVAQTHSTVDWFATARLRAGPTILNDKVWVYGTGGFAYGGVSARAIVDNIVISNDTTRFGWTVGGGVETALAKDWRLKVEYLHVDLGSDSLQGAFANIPIATDSVHNEFDVVRVGVNYKTN